MRQDATMATLKGFGQEYPGAGAARSLLGTVLERYGPRDFPVELWDGEQWPAQADPRPRFSRSFSGDHRANLERGGNGGI